ncbi:MAG: FeoB-associated Cys-rich membrane protein [Lachnospiraceae bacterium]|nr:FeoB-associated Cys-rich membrane protein [Lachnospiraceae bacterium]
MAEDMNTWDIIIIALIAAAVILAIRSIIRRRHSDTGCHGCESCPGCSDCKEKCSNYDH